MKQKLFLGLLAGALVLTSCEDNSDEINALKKRIKTLESMTGSTEPINFNYSSTDYNDEPIVKTTSYRFKASDYQTSKIMDFGGGEYGISVTRYSDVNAEEQAEIYFIYNPETDEVTNAQLYVNFYLFQGYNLNTTFYQFDTEADFSVTVNTFNSTTGLIDVTFHVETTENYGNNFYDGIPQTIDMSFRGKLSYYSNPS